MKISIVLFTSKELKTGEYPVMLNLFHTGKRKRITTGISCKKSNWNEKQKQVRSQDKAYKEKGGVSQSMQFYTKPKLI